MTYKNWYRQVRSHILQIADVDILDLGDYVDLQDAFMDERTPLEVATEILEENGFDMEWLS